MGAGLRSAGRRWLCGREGTAAGEWKCARPPLAVCSTRGPTSSLGAPFLRLGDPSPEGRRPCQRPPPLGIGAHACRGGGVGGKAAAEAGAGQLRRLFQPRRVLSSGFRSLDLVALTLSPFASKAGFKSQVGNVPLRVACASG